MFNATQLRELADLLQFFDEYDFLYFDGKVTHCETGETVRVVVFDPEGDRVHGVNVK